MKPPRVLRSNEGTPVPKSSKTTADAAKTPHVKYHEVKAKGLMGRNKIYLQIIKSVAEETLHQEPDMNQLDCLVPQVHVFILLFERHRASSTATTIVPRPVLAYTTNTSLSCIASAVVIRTQRC